MDVDLPLTLVLAAILGVLFFLADRYKPKIKHDPTFIAGVVTSNFFLVVLPEHALKTPPLLVAFP
ncbi:MAG: hypothetical protein Q6373_005480, partial [Candidatus Sigynarchaeota archaeon]